MTINVKDYGAVGDGIADDLPAIRAALAAAESSTTTKVVRLPGGTYRVKNKFTMPSGVTLEGEGVSSTIVPSYSSLRTANRVIDNNWVTGSFDITLRNFQVRRDTPFATHAMLFNGVDGLVIDGVTVAGLSPWAAGAISVSSIVNSGVDSIMSKNVRVSNCSISDGGNYGVQVGWVDGATVTGNNFANCYREAIGVEPYAPGSARNVAITGNTITGSSVDRGSETGVLVVTESSDGTISNVAITGNTIDGGAAVPDPEVNGGSNGVAAILVLGGKGVTVTGNSITRSFGAGITVGNAAVPTYDTVVTGNAISDGNTTGARAQSGAGISLRNAYNVIVASNGVGGALHTGCIAETAGSTGNLVTGNRLSDSTPTLTPSAGSTYWGNIVGTRRST